MLNNIMLIARKAGYMILHNPTDKGKMYEFREKNLKYFYVEPLVTISLQIIAFENFTDYTRTSWVFGVLDTLQGQVECVGYLKPFQNKLNVSITRSPSKTSRVRGLLESFLGQVECVHYLKPF